MELSIRNLSFSYGRLPVLKDITLKVPSHKLVVILGPNGSGKTTLLKCINGMLKPSSGTVSIGETGVSSIAHREMARRCAYLPQNNQPGRITAFDAVLLGRKPGMGWRVTDHDLAHTEAALKLTGIRDLALRHTDSMSGGEFQKVCLARAIAQEPSLMLLDEPTASLDLKSRMSFMELLHRIVNEHDMSAVVTLHDLNTALRFGNMLVFLQNGEIQAITDPQEVTSEIIFKTYGVETDLIRHNNIPFAVPVFGISQ